MGRRIAGNTHMAPLPLLAFKVAHCLLYVDKLFKLPVGIKKSTLLFNLRLPPELMEAANPGCPEQFNAGDTVSLGVCC